MKRVFYFATVLIVLAVIGFARYLFFDKQAYCLDIGKIYDPVQKICRDDCLSWNNQTGCVPITDENRQKKAAGEL